MYQAPPGVNGVAVKLNGYDIEKCGAEKTIFERGCRTRFLMDWAAVESLSSVICVLSNDVGCDGGFLNVGCLYGRKTQRVLYQAQSLVPSK